MKRFLVGFLMVLALLAFSTVDARALEVENMYGSVGTNLDLEGVSTSDAENLEVGVNLKVALAHSGDAAVGAILNGATETGHGLEAVLRDGDYTYGGYVRVPVPLLERLELQVTRSEHGLTNKNEERVMLYFGRIKSW